MRKIKFLLFTLCLTLSLSSCIKSEEANSEADITSCTIIENGLNGENNILKTAPIIDNVSKGSFSIKLIAKETSEETSMTPLFTTTPGATTYVELDGNYQIYPDEGMTLDLSKAKKIKVISEDQQWTKIYTLKIIRNEIPLHLTFENIKIQHPTKTNSYHDFVELNENNDTIMTWASGNPGFSMTGSKKKPENFPTQQDSNGRMGNSCLKMITMSTGTFGNMVNKTIAAGNLFIGQFETNEAITEPLKATKFGLPFSQIPTGIKGFYKYKKGAIFTEVGKEKPSRNDIGDIYAIFYETDKNFETLDGTNQFTDEHIVSIARIGIQSSEMLETNEWTEFNIPFVDIPGKYVNLQKLEEGAYKLAIVFSSSKEGDKFNGAVGSTLWIDDVDIIIKK